MKIYTRNGDQGETDLIGGSRVPKDTERLEVCGTLDELNALLGLARCETLPEGAAALLEQLQHQLFDIGAELATPEPPQAGFHAIELKDVEAIEQAIDRFSAMLEPLGTFILPSGSRGAAVLHVARAVARRAERRLVSFAILSPQAVSPFLLSYINRLSDLLFVLARSVNALGEVPETPC